MKAVVLENTCKAQDLKVSEVNIPKVRDDWVLVKVLGFGINRSEVILRDYEADEDYINLPVIPGIECVGEIVDESSTDFSKGDKIVALMGGMGRSFDGSYAEYALLPQKNVFKISDEALNHLTIEEIIAIPETYFTSYGSISTLNLAEDDTLLIRGATSATGLTAMQLASAIGCRIIATSRDKKRFEKLKDYGADECVVDDGDLSSKISCNKILELIGPKTLADSLNLLEEDGICCVTGVLGGIEYLNDFDPIKYLYKKYLTSFFSNFPTQEIIDDIFNFIIENDIKPAIGRVFTSLDDISEAHSLMESNSAQGKIIFQLI
ncbi:zinc-binding dehydrogenase [Methanobrevibacter sp.]|uniref:zinc-binding dehydrogenase n=1 Tax=Methanobrevibacter sp. TaxID=66852 RepID=UPI00388D6017